MVHDVFDAEIARRIVESTFEHKISNALFVNDKTYHDCDVRFTVSALCSIRLLS